MSTRDDLRTLPAVAVAVAIVGLVVAGCGPGRGTSPAAAPTTPAAPTPATSSGGPAAPAVTAAPSASPTAPGAAYRAVGNLCTAVDVSALRAQVGAAEPKPAARFQRTDSGTILSCTIRLGSLGNAGAVIVLAYIYADHTAQQPFQALRALENYPATPVPGVGTEAYSYLDHSNRPHVAAWDANLQLGVLYLPNRPLNNPRDLLPALIEVCKATIAALQRLSTAPAGTGGRRPV